MLGGFRYGKTSSRYDEKWTLKSTKRPISPRRKTSEDHEAVT